MVILGDNSRTIDALVTLQIKILEIQMHSNCASEKWLNSRYSLKVEQKEFLHWFLVSWEKKESSPSLLTEQVIGWNYLLLRKRLCFDWEITLEWKSSIQCYMYSVKTLDICRDVSEVVNLWYSRFEKSRLYIQILESRVPLCLPIYLSIASLSLFIWCWGSNWGPCPC